MHQYVYRSELLLLFFILLYVAALMNRSGRVSQTMMRAVKADYKLKYPEEALQCFPTISATNIRSQDLFTIPTLHDSLQLSYNYLAI